MTNPPTAPPGSRDRDLIHVAAAALVDRAGRILLAQRADDAHQGGLWEFPGGKLEPGDGIDDGLARELHEELGIVPLRHRPLIRVTHDYGDRRVLLAVHLVSEWHGDPHGREGQPLRWVEPARLATYPMPPADVPIVAALTLPSSYVITPPQIGDERRLFAGLEATLGAGARLLQLRLFDITGSELHRIGRRFCAVCREQGARVLLNGDVGVMRAIGADGLHLSSRQLNAAMTRPAAHGELLAASCHTPTDLMRAAAIGADFALLSPVLPTRSHPDADPLGWDTFAAWVDPVPLPVYALGGMSPELLDIAFAHGAQGVAGIRGLWIESA